LPNKGEAYYIGKAIQRLQVMFLEEFESVNKLEIVMKKIRLVTIIRLI